MTKKTASKKTTKKKTPKKRVSPSDQPKINRRKEWRLELPLAGKAEGKLPKGKKFTEVMTLNNISSGGAYFCLESGVIIKQYPPQGFRIQKRDRITLEVSK